jgi:hypothetical protein
LKLKLVIATDTYLSDTFPYELNGFLFREIFSVVFVHDAQGEERAIAMRSKWNLKINMSILS